MFRRNIAVGVARRGYKASSSSSSFYFSEAEAVGNPIRRGPVNDFKYLFLRLPLNRDFHFTAM